MKFRRMGSNRTLPPLFIRRRAAERGSILVYIVMTMVIFGLLGALMVSLFSTSDIQLGYSQRYAARFLFSMNPGCAMQPRNW